MVLLLARVVGVGLETADMIQEVLSPPFEIGALARDMRG